MTATTFTPPHDFEAETMLLAALMFEADRSDIVGEVFPLVSADDFYRPPNGALFAAITKIWSKGESVNVLSVEQTMSAGDLEELGGPARLHELAFDIRSLKSLAPDAARKLRRLRKQRDMIRVCQEGLQIAYDTNADVDAALDGFERAVFDLAHGEASADADDLIGIELLDHIAVLEQRIVDAEAGEIVGGVPTGLIEIDALLSGMTDGMYVVGAPPGTGKSSFAMDAACYNAARGMPVLGFNQEMTKPQILDRYVASQAGIPLEHIRTGKMDGRDIDKVRALQARTCEWPLKVIKRPKVSPMEIRAEARKFRARHGGLGLMFVDYLQLMRLGERAENRQNEVSRVVEEISAIGMEFEVPVIALAQLNRSANTAVGVRPTQHDLKDSGAIEANAEAVLLLYREDIHNEAALKGVAEVIVDKNRHGPCGVAEVAWAGGFTTFRNLDRRHADPEMAAAVPSMGADGATPDGEF